MYLNKTILFHISVVSEFLSINHIFLNIYVDNYIHTSIIIPWDESLKRIKSF